MVFRRREGIRRPQARKCDTNGRRRPLVPEDGIRKVRADMIKGEKDRIDLSFEDMQFVLALYKTQSLTQTASDMGLSMGAASRRLAHVREVFGDELFVRSGQAMLPTSRMRDLKDRLAELVAQTRRLLKPDPLELHDMSRAVRLISADNGIATLLSAAVERFFEKTGAMTQELLRRRPAVCVNVGMRDGGSSGVAGRRVGVTVPYFLTVPYVVSRTDFTFEGPLITLRRFMKDTQFNFRILPMPQESAPFEPRLVWHHCTHTDPFLQWVRGLVVDAARSEARLLGVIDPSEG